MVLTTAITSSTGTPLANAYSWSFWIGADNDLTGYLFEDDRFPGPYGIIEMVPVDVNNDDAIDIAITGYFDDIVRILINDGTGHFAEFEVPPERSITIQVKVRQDPAHASTTRQEFNFVLTPLGETDLQSVKHSSMFYNPAKNLKQ